MKIYPLTNKLLSNNTQNWHISSDISKSKFCTITIPSLACSVREGKKDLNFYGNEQDKTITTKLS